VSSLSKSPLMRDCSISQFQRAALLELESHKKSAAGLAWRRIRI